MHLSNNTSSGYYVASPHQPDRVGRKKLLNEGAFSLMTRVAGLGVAPSLEDYAHVSLIAESVGLYLLHNALAYGVRRIVSTDSQNNFQMKIF